MGISYTSDKPNLRNVMEKFGEHLGANRNGKRLLDFYHSSMFIITNPLLKIKKRPVAAQVGKVNF